MRGWIDDAEEEAGIGSPGGAAVFAMEDLVEIVDGFDAGQAAGLLEVVALRVCVGGMTGDLARDVAEPYGCS